ncbi:hypothetical protein [Sphingobacterium sp.]|uniref:hypothetical protein n=1 Tax=Sphingobacterium sp. TaxID=341027 RepID=UPI0028A2BCDB|nr:hypothetical protein [Sphingobacterium sp.]
MKTLCILFFMLINANVSFTQCVENSHFKFLEINISKNSKEKGKHISIKSPRLKTDGLVNITDDRTVFFMYSKKNRLKILQEYLYFREDTSVSNKFFIVDGSSRSRRFQGITVEIEALFTFSWLLIRDYPKIEPKLYFRETKIPVTKDEDLKSIFRIYKKYFENLKQNNGKISYWPLDGTPYCWKGEPFNKEIYLSKSLW